MCDNSSTDVQTRDVLKSILKMSRYSENVSRNISGIKCIIWVNFRHLQKNVFKMSYDSFLNILFGKDNIKPVLKNYVCYPQ